MESRFDLFQKLERLDNFLVCVLAGFEITEGGLGPFAGIGEASCDCECDGCTGTRLCGAETVLYGLFAAD